MESENQQSVETVGEISEPVAENKNVDAADTAEPSDTIDVIGNGQLVKKVLMTNC